MAKINISLEVDEELVEIIDKRIKQLGEHGPETDRSKYIRSLIKRDVQSAEPAKKDARKAA